MQSVSAGFGTAAGAVARQVVDCVEISWDGSGSIAAARGGTGWTDETAYMISHSGSLRLNGPGVELVKAGDIGTATIKLSNPGGRFSWQLATGPLYAQIGGPTGLSGKPVRLWVGFIVAGVAEYCRIFTGVLADWNEDTAAGTVDLICRDWGWQYLQNKLSSPLYEKQPPEDWIETVANLAGILDADMTLDPGLFPIPWVWLDDESAVEEIWETARAEGGLAYFDQLGKLRFENVLHWASAPHTATQWTFTEGDYQQDQPAFTTDDVTTKVITEWSGRAMGAPIVVYNLETVKTIPPGGSIFWRARFDHPAVSLIQPAWQEPFRDYAALSAGGVSLTSHLTITLSEVCGQQCKITVANAHTAFAATLLKLQIRGYPLVGRPAEQVEALASPPPYAFERVRTERGNVYVQTHNQAQALVSYLAVKNGRVRPTWPLWGVPGVPQLELGDRVAFYDTAALGAAARQGFLVGIDWTGSQDLGFVQNLQILDPTGLWTYSDYFIIGVTALGHHGRCWF